MAMSLFNRSNGDPKVRYAVVGLGWIAQAAILPAFKNARRNSDLVALVSGDDEKLADLSARYGVKGAYRYEQYDDLLRSGDIDAVYIALPNNMHKEYSVRAAAAGIHVLSEKPMAVSEVDCRAMIDAARASHVKLMIAYRLHFEIANLEAIEVVQSGMIGEPRIFDSVFSQRVTPGNSRLVKNLGEDAAVMDMGIYCINAARYLFQDEPLELSAMMVRGKDPRFADVGEMTSVTMRFPEDRVATFTCSFGGAPVGYYEVVGTEGRLRVSPAYDFESDLVHYLTIGDEKTKERRFKKRDQFGPEILYFSDCIQRDVVPEPSGFEGLADVRIIEAIHRSIETKRPVTLSPMRRTTRPAVAQAIGARAVREPRMIHASPPTAPGK
jgi:predicted dehydrogenase